MLGRVGDVLTVLLKHFRPDEPLTGDEEKAITALRAMLNEIADIKERHDRQAIRPSWRIGEQNRASHTSLVRAGSMTKPTRRWRTSIRVTEVQGVGVGWPAALASARQSISVAVCVLAARWWRRRSSRPVGYAVGNIGFLFGFGKDGRDALRRSPAEIPDPPWGGGCRGRAEYETRDDHLQNY